jgi:hypothetical protein
MPTRLLHVGSNSDRVRFCMTESLSLSDPVKYTTLSHCSGTPPCSSKGKDDPTPPNGLSSFDSNGALSIMSQIEAGEFPGVNARYPLRNAS